MSLDSTSHPNDKSKHFEITNLSYSKLEEAYGLVNEFLTIITLNCMDYF